MSKPHRNRKYLDAVKVLNCVDCGAPADDPHHLIGHGQGGMGTKVSDYWTMPMCRPCHSALHDHGWKAWETRNGSQWRHVVRTFTSLIDSGLITIGKGK